VYRRTNEKRGRMQRLGPPHSRFVPPAISCPLPFSHTAVRLRASSLAWPDPCARFPLQTPVCFLYLSSPLTLSRHAQTLRLNPKPTSALSSRPSTDPGGSGPRYTEVLYEVEEKDQTICRMYRVYLITYATDFAHKGFCTMAASAAASGFALNVLGEGKNSQKCCCEKVQNPKSTLYMDCQHSKCICDRMGGRRVRVRGEYRFSSLVKQKKREKIRCFLLHRKKNFFYIYDVITWGKRKKALLTTAYIYIYMSRHTEWVRQRFFFYIYDVITWGKYILYL
jgi:hypothetical protein